MKGKVIVCGLSVDVIPPSKEIPRRFFGSCETLFRSFWTPQCDVCEMSPSFFFLSLRQSQFLSGTSLGRKADLLRRCVEPWRCNAGRSRVKAHVHTGSTPWMILYALLLLHVLVSIVGAARLEIFGIDASIPSGRYNYIRKRVFSSRRVTCCLRHFSHEEYI